MNLSSKSSLYAVLILLVSTGCTDNPYRDEDAANQVASYGVLVHPMTNNHSAAPGFDTDFILTVSNIGTQTTTYDINVLSKDDGIDSVLIENNASNITVLAGGVLPLIVNVDLKSSASGMLKTEIEFRAGSNETNFETSQVVTLEVNSDVSFGEMSQIGDLVYVHYAGILAKDSKLFDSSMEYVWDTYPYYNYGVSDANRHIDTLPANNIGCFEQSTKDGVILSYVDTRFSAYEGGLRVGMEIYEFEGQKINTYEEFYDAINTTVANQTVSISIVNETAGLDNFTVNMTDLGEFYVEYYSGYYQSWMDGKGFMGINAEEKTELNAENCMGSRQMIVGFDNKMVGMYEGQTLAVRIPAKDAYGEVGYSPLAGEDLLFLIEMVETIHTVVVQEPEDNETNEPEENVTEEPKENVTQDYNMTVTEVVDGDTFYLGNGDKVRMLGINTPESGRPYAQEATDFLTNMILGKEVTLVNDSKNSDSDTYGRLLAHVYVNGTSVNYEIIKAGYAFWYPYSSGTDFDTQYEEAQAFASNNAVGLWTKSSYNFTIDHIEYNPEGSEADGEYLVLTNHENFNVSMIGWFLQDEAAQTAYEFNFTIANNTSIRIYTGEGIDNSTTLYWGWYQGIWNNSGDFAVIQDENGYMVANYRY
ncbi:MAG: thermonuclease family protein [Candidatus Thermoplasmatota archaeon]|nr:thermonuclease family protein [Candidatus Thermoplasmatota archaeon]